MSEYNCLNQFFKLSKDSRFDAIELLVNELCDIGEAEVFVNIMDLHISQTGSDIVKNNEEIETLIPTKKESEVDKKPISVAAGNVGSKAKLFSCDNCDQQFNSAGSRYRHIRRVHLDKPYTCDICQKQWAFKTTLEDHKRFHTGERPYACSICGKTFFKSSHLKTHGLIHSERRLFFCDNCGKQFKSESYCITHMQTAHGGKKVLYSCEKCDKKFASQGSCRNHNRRVHEDYRPFICDVCLKPFASKADMEIHRRVHTGVRPYSCSTCGKTFNRNSYLEKHRKNYHPENNNNSG